MPTVILLDVSLSMTRPVAAAEGGGEAITRRQLAEAGLSALFDFVAANDKLEFTALVIFSSLWEVVVPFTRDYNELKKALYSVEIFDKTNLEGTLDGVRSVVGEEWGVTTTCQVILVTDGSPGVGPGSLKQVAQMLSNPKPDDPPFHLPFEFPNSLEVVLLASPAELQQWDSRALYQKLLDANRQKGKIHVVEGALTPKSAQLMFSRLAEEHYSAFRARLQCGHLSSEVQLFPPPRTVSMARDFEMVTQTVSSELNICGFLDCADVSSPPVMSRHLVLPLATKEKSHAGSGEGGAEGADKTDDKDSGPTSSEIGSTPSFCVLLHGSLKIENLVALVNVGENWYGLLHSCADSKKKSNLMMSLFEPGDKAIPWLGRFHLLGPCSAFANDPYGEDSASTKSPFPVRLQEKRSYSQNPVVWIKPTSLQADIQKILRYARKLPEKTQVFYKELNRLRRAALALGMTELLSGMSMMLERECTILPWTAHPDAAMQLTHAAKMITSAMDKGYDYSIIPLSTNFASDS
ncbi:integrator complex subunit 14-like [Acanthaster planci]|uniref:Integrator complex subunit 14 n=1 Tax=Acanthaster planci TaxID=133434 RepID=A0A8B7ZRJ7_ACAPL|nr:integrator complex subunit 14-like [Acanthaster planci]XP_022108019.1 integrator complex subunit 14-like [Acanthaster planci]